VLLPLIQSTLELLPHSSTEPIVELAHLTLSTRELLQHLSNVSDTLHMSRQTTTNATRRLRTSKEQLHEWKRENEKTEEGRTYIERGDWDRKLREREAKRACANVVEALKTSVDSGERGSVKVWVWRVRNLLHLRTSLTLPYGSSC
jgi:hypothetical protein